MDRSRRYEDGEVRRFGAGESYRPFNRDRSPRGGRSPLRDRGRTPPGASDSYVPGRSPRRRSRSPDRFRRDRSRDRDGAERWRRSRSRARSPVRRLSPRRSPLRRTPPRFMSPRRDDRVFDRRDDRRDDRDDRPRSPLRRDFEIRDMRRRSRSPFDRDRFPIRRDRSPPRRSPPPGLRGGGSYRPRSRSPDRRDRDDRYTGPAYRRPSPLPFRDSAASSALNSRPASGRSSPRPTSVRRDDRSGPQSPTRSHVSNAPTPTSSIPPARETPKQPAPPPQSLQPAQATRSSTPIKSEYPDDQPAKPPLTDANSTPIKSPPKGPAALRAPPTGPAASRNFTSPAAPPAAPVPRHPLQGPTGQARPGATSPTVPPAGPRGYIPPRGAGYAARGGRGNWTNGPARHSISGTGPSSSPTVPPTGPSSIPTGPRAHSTSSATGSPSLTSKPFNPPTGPAAHGTPHPRPTLAQSLLNTMPPIIPGGKLDPTAMPIEMDAHHRKLREEEERLREELRAKQDKLRKSLRVWDRMERESKAFELKSDLSERSLKNIAGEGVGGAAF